MDLPTWKQNYINAAGYIYSACLRVPGHIDIADCVVFTQQSAYVLPVTEPSRSLQ